MTLKREHDSQLLIYDTDTISFTTETNTSYYGSAVDLQPVDTLSYGLKLSRAIGADLGKLTFNFQFSSADANDEPAGDWTDCEPLSIMPRFMQPPNNLVEDTADDVNGNPYQQPIGIAGDAPKRFVRVVITVGGTALLSGISVLATPIAQPMMRPTQVWKLTGKFPDDGRD